MKITFLGTGTSQGVPIVTCPCKVCRSDDVKDKRLRSSIFVQVNGIDILIDIGPDFRQQALKNKISKVDSILITHEHNDHIAGLDDIRPYNFIQNNSIPLYGLPRVIDQIIYRYGYIFSENKYPGAPSIDAVTVSESDIITIGDTHILAIPIFHGDLPIIGFRINNFAYITDASTIPQQSLDMLKDLDTLIINALQHRPHKTHFTLSEAIDAACHINAKHTFFTHLSHDIGFHEEIDKALPQSMHLAFDGLQLSL